MLLIDGVKYQEWTPEKEVEEFHPLVKEHFREIFGDRCLFIEGNILKSEAGIGAKPDWFVISFGDASEWHIVEAELSSHRLYDHIVNQVGRFINGIKNTTIQRKIIEAIYHEIIENKIKKAEIEEAIGSGEIYKFLSDLISRSPILTIIIEMKTPELDEAINLLRYSPIRIVEFQTFTREGTGLPVHAHLFEPLFEPSEVSIVSRQLEAAIYKDAVESDLTKNNINYHFVHIDEAKRGNFPADKVRFILETNIGEIETNVTGTPSQRFLPYIKRNLKQWFKAHPELKRGDKLRISVIEPMKKYRLEIVKP